MRIKIKVTAPKSVIDKRKILSGAEAGLDVVAQEAETLLAKPTGTWRHKPKMRTDKAKGRRSSGTDDDIYRYVNDGTKAHVIRAKRGRLAFGPSTPKTRPGSLTPRAGSRKAANKFPRQVNHPGTRARKFDEAAAKRLQRQIAKIIQAEITKALS